ncbi:MAG: RecQ family ATP-dependent DNA helicase [Polaribacter sp.]
MISAKNILKRYWGFSEFRDPQEEIINSVLEKKDTIALLPTGGGKSICFQIPALMQEGICIVISPLIALMQDQVENLKNLDIKAITIPSGTLQDDIITLFDNLKFGNFKFLYLSPERLQSAFMQQKIKELNVNLIAIDEAHCISEWGHDFRPSYRNIKVLRDLKPETNFIAVTATADKKVINDISKNLTLNKPVIFRKSFFREHLAYQIYTIEDKLLRLKQIFIKTKTPAIVYVNSRKKTEEIANFLNANTFKSSYYHGGLSLIEKQLSFDNWMTEKTPIMVATNAFGMGIDKPNVGVVVHFNLPSSIENYVQETGRAGRDNEKSFAVLLQNENDILLFKKQLENSLPTIDEIKEVHKKIYQHFRIANGELIENSFEFNLFEFSKKYDFIPNKVAIILKILANNGILEISTHFNKKSRLQCIASSKQVLAYSHKNKRFRKTINSLLRTYGGLFEQESNINEFLLAKETGITSQQMIENLKQLEKDHLVIYKPVTTDSEITFLLPREDDKTINRCAKEIKLYIHQKRKKANDFINFIKNNKVCRSIQLLHYFDETTTNKCGICDVCLSEKKYRKTISTASILELLANNKSTSSKEICEVLEGNEEDILIHLRSLLSTNKIAIDNQNRYYLYSSKKS